MLTHRVKDSRPLRRHTLLLNIADTGKKVKSCPKFPGEKSVDREENMSIMVCTMEGKTNWIQAKQGGPCRLKDVIE